MRRTIRTLTLLAGVIAVGYYLWHGLTYRADGIDGAVLGWVDWQMALPILALTFVPIVFAFTSTGMTEAFTGLGQVLTGRNSTEFRDAPVGIATVTAVRQTGVSVNDQPQVHLDLTVEDAAGHTFASQAKIIVPLIELALMRPGVVLPVRYLPGRTDKVEIDRSGDQAAAQHAWNETMIRRGFTTPAKLDIAARGIPAQAVVQSLSVPGEIRDGFTRIALILAVTRPDGTTFTTNTEKFLPPTSIDLVQIGRIVQVHYLPGAEQDVVLSLPVQT
ncbi:hypothetical protein [Nocardia macrotermitis]|uniref:Uncharacterized protein n=1 Tax=Nocardia macrotermitis TaxID=2585198 RepID=A0A7K0D443_9NOCA|nr:hypothetical protein [Nocardia macrotermitis]MQY20498.1 hypothetical protein [Nocardia macrotermitis]